MRADHTATSTAVTHRSVLAIALPIVASNVSTPLIGVVDTAVVGQLGEAYYIGAVAIGSLIFTFLFWAFGFLRMGTTGFTAQAEGAGDNDELRAVLARALVIAGLAGLALIVLQSLIGIAAFSMIDASENVETHAQGYFAIRIWSAPAALANFAILGWFIGLGRAPIAFLLQIILNFTNIVLDGLFVLVFDMRVEGVAIGTVIAEISAAGIGFLFVHRELKSRAGDWNMELIRNVEKLKRMLAVNGDIMIRTLCLIFSFSWFTARSAEFGDTILAANTVLMNLFGMSAYLLDGFAFAAEVHVGKAVGARSETRFKAAVAISSLWAFGLCLIISLAFLLLGGYAVDLMTVNQEVRDTARTYLFWAALAPIFGIACFQLDGIYIGATRTVDMRNMMILSMAIYLVAWWYLELTFGNHGLWASLIVLFIVRGVTLGSRYPALLRDSFASPATIGR